MPSSVSPERQTRARHGVDLTMTARAIAGQPTSLSSRDIQDKKKGRTPLVDLFDQGLFLLLRPGGGGVVAVDALVLGTEGKDNVSLSARRGLRAVKGPGTDMGCSLTGATRRASADHEGILPRES